MGAGGRQDGKFYWSLVINCEKTKPGRVWESARRQDLTVAGAVLSSLSLSLSSSLFFLVLPLPLIGSHRQKTTKRLPCAQQPYHNHSANMSDPLAFGAPAEETTVSSARASVPGVFSCACARGPDGPPTTTTQPPTKTTPHTTGPGGPAVGRARSHRRRVRRPALRRRADGDSGSARRRRPAALWRRRSRGPCSSCCGCACGG